MTVHAKLTEKAYNLSTLNAKLLEFGVDGSQSLGESYFDNSGSNILRRRSFDFDTSERISADKLSSLPVGWLVRGAVREDDITAFDCSVSSYLTKHWYNPHAIPGVCNPQDDPYGDIFRTIDICVTNGRGGCETNQKHT